jgi:hypothetical protein
MGKPSDRVIFKADESACGGAFCALAVFTAYPGVVVRLDLPEEPPQFDHQFSEAVEIDGHKVE